MNRGRHKKRNKNNFCTLPELCRFIKQNLEILLEHIKNTHFSNISTRNDCFAKAYYSVDKKIWWSITMYYIDDQYYIYNFIQDIKQRIQIFKKETIYYLKFYFGQEECIIKYKVQ